jgi:hypothetical protein
MYGAEMLFNLLASGQRNLLEQMQSDEAAISIFCGDYYNKTTVGKVVRSWLTGRWPLIVVNASGGPGTPAQAAREYLFWLENEDPAFRLSNSVTQNCKAHDAQTWEQFWIEALPAIRDFYDPPKK